MRQKSYFQNRCTMTSSVDDDSIRDTESIRLLSDSRLAKLCLGLSRVDSAGVYYWKRLAEHFGLRDNKVCEQVLRDVEMGRNKNPGYTILSKWMEKERNCTIKVLEMGLRLLEREDLVDELDDIRKDYVALTVTLTADGVNHDLSGQCPGRRPIVDYIRVTVKTNIATALLRGGRSSEVFIKMVNLRHDRNWSSPARNFQGDHIFLEKVQDPSQFKKRFSEISGKKDAFFAEVQRHFFSLMLDDILVFMGEDKPMAQASIEDRAKVVPSNIDNTTGPVATSTTDPTGLVQRNKKKTRATSSDDELTHACSDVDYPTTVLSPVQETTASSSLSSIAPLPVTVVNSRNDSGPTPQFVSEA